MVNSFGVFLFSSLTCEVSAFCLRCSDWVSVSVVSMVSVVFELVWASRWFIVYKVWCDTENTVNFQVKFWVRFIKLNSKPNLENDACNAICVTNSQRLASFESWPFTPAKFSLPNGVAQKNVTNNKVRACHLHESSFITLSRVFSIRNLNFIFSQPFSIILTNVECKVNLTLLAIATFEPREKRVCSFLLRCFYGSWLAQGREILYFKIKGVARLIYFFITV